MVIIGLEAREAAELLDALAGRGRSLVMPEYIERIINRYFPAAHIMDKEQMAEGYKEMGEINLAVANGDQEG